MKNMFIVWAIALLLSNVASAMPWVGTLQKKAANRLLGHTHREAISPAACANFSGAWKGTCEADGQSTPDTQVFVQDGCTGLFSSNNWINIGGLRGENDALATEAGFAMGVASAMTYDWSADRNSLIIRSYGLVKQIGADYSHSFQGNGSMRLENGKLLFGFELAGLKVACSYEKQ